MKTINGQMIDGFPHLTDIVHSFVGDIMIEAAYAHHAMAGENNSVAPNATDGSPTALEHGVVSNLINGY